MELALKKEKKAAKRLARILAGACLAASIFGARSAKAQEAPDQGRLPAVIAVGGARLSATSGVSFDPFAQTINYSGLSYHLGDDDFSLRYGGRDTNVIGYLSGFDFSDLSHLPQLLDFGRALRESLGIYSPGSYHRELAGSLDAFAEGYTAAPGISDGRPYYVELGASGQLYARGRAGLDLRLDYDNWDLPTRFDSTLSAWFAASMRSSVSLGLEANPDSGFGYGIMGRRFSSFDGAGTLSASIHAGLLSGFNADAGTNITQRTALGYDFVPYLTFRSDEGPLRLSVNAGLDIRSEDDRSKSDQRTVHASLDRTQDSSQDISSTTLSHITGVIPAFSAVLAPSSPSAVYPVLSLSTLDSPSARGAVGLSAGRLLASGYLSSGLEAGGEALISLRGGPSTREFDDYLFRSESARAGFFPSYRSRMLAARQAFLTSSDSLMLRSSLDYDPRFPQLTSENGFIYSSGRFFIEDGIQLFCGESAGAGLYNSIGNRYVFSTQSYSRTVAGNGPVVQSVLFSIGGFIP